MGLSNGSETRLRSGTRREIQGLPKWVTSNAEAQPTTIPASTSLG